VFRTRAAVKIQDGCDRFCTYCIVPHVRGRAVSRPPASVLEEVRRVVAGGAREIVLTGVNLGRFSYGETDFPALLERILGCLPEDGRVRLRISSLEPEGLDARFTRLFSDRRLAPHVHLCLQSGSDRILERMNRHYRVEDVRRIAAGLRDADPALNLTTDIIVGFPGETEEDAAASRAVATELGFGHIHVFPFSPREGTAAARMPDQVPAAVKRERARALRELGTRLKRRYYGSLVGGAEEVLVETAGARGAAAAAGSDGATPGEAGAAAAAPGSDSATPGAAAAAAGSDGAGARGYGRSYVPVRIDGAELSCNEIYPVTLTGLAEDAQGPILTAVIRRPG
jgi:threonylcarbamoyladenosine tRNA methylthiotransferase MtaB